MFNSHLIKCTYIRFKPSNPEAGPPLFASSAYQFIPPTNHGPLSHPYLQRDARRKSAQIKRKLPSATGAKTIISNYNWGMYTVSVVVVGLRSWHRCSFFIAFMCTYIHFRDIPRFVLDYNCVPEYVSRVRRVTALLWSRSKDGRAAATRWHFGPRRMAFSWQRVQIFD